MASATQIRAVNFSRVWAMPNSETFSVPPIGEFVQKYLARAKVSVDPFARDKRWTTFTNDINPNTAAEHHMDAVAFIEKLIQGGIQCDLLILDMPYSPRQISECYRELGLKCAMRETQSSVLYMEVRDVAVKLLTADAIVLSFGWNSVGMGKKHGFEIEEIMLCCHGGAHNDTICLAERRIA